MNIAIVFIGGGFGAVCRYLVSMGFSRLVDPTRPYLATLLINVLGSILMGVLIGALTRGAGAGERWRLLLGVGVLGGFTTFSAYSLETVMMIERKAYALAGAYVVGSVMFGVAGLMLGLTLMRKVAL